VYSRIRELILDGHFAPGTRLPSESELGELFGVSRVTLREALRMLQGDMLTESRQGSGHYVMDSTRLVKTPITVLQSVTDLMGGLGYPVETRVISVAIQPGGQYGRHLKLTKDERVLRLERLRTSEAVPMIYSVDIFPERLLGQEPAAWEGSLLNMLAAAGVGIAYSHSTIRAVILPRNAVRLVGLPRTLPWVLMEQINYSAEHKPVLYSLDYHRGDKFEFETLRHRSSHRPR
jgi:GntR family transcriptional regulator